MQSRLLALAAVAVIALAGCAENQATEPATDHDGQDDGNQTVEPVVNATNAAPSASLEADVLNGTAPLMVNLTLDGADPDGDNLTWELRLLAAGTGNATGNATDTLVANGTTLPAHTDITFDEAGNFTLRLTVSDGQNTTSQDLTIAVTGDLGPSVEPIFQTFHMVEGCELCIDGDNPVTGQPGADGCIGWNLGDNELDCAWMEIPPEYIGTPWSAYSYTDGTIPLLGTDGDVDVEFYDVCDHDGTPIQLVREKSFGEPESGIIPEGAGCIVGFEFSWPNLGHTIEFSLGAVVHE